MYIRTPMQRIIMHIDMNSYFATCEQQDNLAWRGKPLGVCEHLGGIIIAPSIEAKRWGIKTGTPVWEARKLYPKIILTPTTPDRYRHYTAKFLKVLADYTDDLEKYSIDEAFLDITETANLRRKANETIDPFREAVRMAKEIKRRVTNEVGDYLKVSVGIATNKLLAKVGSDFQKPDGLTVFKPEDKDRLYKILKLTDMPGIARRTERNLQELGIKTLIDLKNYPVSKLVAHFGIMGYHMHKIGQLEGSWKEEFTEDQPIKSMGHMYTLEIQHRTAGSVPRVLYKLSEMVAARLRVNGLMGNVLHAYIRTPGDESLGGSKKMSYWLQDGRDIFLESARLLESSVREKDSPFSKRTVLTDMSARLVGVTVAGLVPFADQISLFPVEEKRKRIAPALDKINEKYGDFTVARTPAHLARNIIRDSVGFGRMKEFKTSNFRPSK